MPLEDTMAHMHEYEFTVKLIGVGESPSDAWDDVLETYRLKFHDGDYEMPEDYLETADWYD